MDPTLGASLIAGVCGVFGVWLSNRNGKKRDRLTNAALDGGASGGVEGSSPARKSGEERFIDYLTSSITMLNTRLETIEADRDRDEAVIAELRGRVAELERLDRAKDAYIIILRSWGANSLDTPPRTPPVPSFPFLIDLPPAGG